MPETEDIVINTGPLFAIIAGIGDLSLLERLYKRVLVPLEVCQEIEAGGASGFGVTEFRKAGFLHKRQAPLEIQPFIRNSLDLGEASVIQLALDENIMTVCIDETAGRRIARLNDLKLTGSITVEMGTNIVVGQDMARLKREVSTILKENAKKGKIPPLWDGKASERIANIIMKWRDNAEK